MTYKIALEVSDFRGGRSLFACTNSITIDSSLPTGGWVIDGLGPNDLQYQSTKTIRATWYGFQTIYGVGKYEVAIFNEAINASNHVELQAFVNVNLDKSFTKAFPTISDGSNVTARVRAYTKAGLYAEISSNGVIVDTSAPFPGSVFDGPSTSSDLQYSNWTSTFELSWEQFTDPHSPISEYKVGVQRGPKIDNKITPDLVSAGLKTSAQLSGLTLLSGETYCGLVVATNAAGLRTQAQSDCLLIDHDAPLAGVVFDGAGVDEEFQSEKTVFNGNWFGFQDPNQGSGIGEYIVMITDQNGNIVIPWSSTGLKKNISFTGLHLVDGVTYYLWVRAFDRAKNYVDVRSNGVTVDTTPPTFSGVTVEGRRAEKDGKTVIYIPDNDRIVATWPQFDDVHSGMKKYQWSVVLEGEEPSLWKELPENPLSTSAVFT